MKRILNSLLLIASFFAIEHTASAQWGYMTPEQANRAAYEAGQNWARNFQSQNNAAYASGQVWAATFAGKQALANQNYSTALSKFKEAVNLSNGSASCGEALMFIGVCCELGMGCDINKSLASKYYQRSANLGYYASTVALQRIAYSGYWPANSTTRSNFCATLAASLNSNIPYSGGNVSSSSSSSGSSNRSSNSSRYGYYNCPTCYGSGRCQTCDGNGNWHSPYTGQVSSCPNCTSNRGRCSVCNGTGKKYGVVR